MSKDTSPLVALAAAIDLPTGGTAPEWVHLLPTAKGAIQTYDGRGPYRVDDAQAVIAASMVDPRGLLIDENHSTDLAAPEGREAPARGWITALEARADGIWGKVDWTPTGTALLAERAYRGISPVFVYDAAGKVIRIKHAALTNKPNLQGLTALHSENAMSLKAIAKVVGLGEDATEAAIIAAIGNLNGATALQSSLIAIGAALGVEGGDATAILAAAKTAKGGETVNTALQAEVTALASELKVLTDATAKAKAEGFVDDAIRLGRAGVKNQRDRFIAMHAQDPAATEALINGLPALGGASQISAQPPAGAEITALNAEQAQVADQLGIPHDKYLAALQADAKKETR